MKIETGIEIKAESETAVEGSAADAPQLLDVGAALTGDRLRADSSESSVPVFVQPVRFEKIPAKVGDKLILFDPTEIDYIESHEGVANLHVLQGSYACSMSLSDLEARLKGFGFYRCHRSYLVNLQKVREVITWTRNSYSLILDNQTKSSIPLWDGFSIQPIIEVNQLLKAFGNKHALQHIQFHIQPGEIFGFLGPSGSGKRGDAWGVMTKDLLICTGWMVVSIAAAAAVYSRKRFDK